MKLPVRGDKGAALGLVLIFVSVFSVWLSATLLISQTAASAVARAQQDLTEVNAAASLTAKALSQMETKNLSTGLPNQSDCGVTVLPESFDGTTFSVECTPAQDGSFGTTTKDSIILYDSTGAIGFKNGGTSSQTVTVFNQDGTAKSTDMRNNGSQATQGNIKLEGSAKVKADQQCSETGTTGLVAKFCDNKGPDKSDITRTDKSLWQALTGSKTKSTNLVSSLTSLCRKSALDTTSVTSTTTGSNGRTTTTVVKTIKTMTLSPGVYGTAEVTTLNSIFLGTGCPGAPGSDKEWVGSSSVELQAYLSPGTYVFKGTQPLTVNSPFLVVNSRLPDANGNYGACVRDPNKSGFTDIQLQGSPDGVELHFEESARLVINNGQVDLCATSYQMLFRNSVVADLNVYTGTADVVRMELIAAGAKPSFVAYGQMLTPASTLYFQASGTDSVRLLGGVVAKGLTIVPPTGSTNYTLTTGTQSTPGERYVTLTVKATKNGSTRTLSKTTVRVKDNYRQTEGGRPVGYELKKVNG